MDCDDERSVTNIGGIFRTSWDNEIPKSGLCGERMMLLGGLCGGEDAADPEPDFCDF